MTEAYQTGLIEIQCLQGGITQDQKRSFSCVSVTERTRGYGCARMTVPAARSEVGAKAVENIVIIALRSFVKIPLQPARDSPI
jgi:hypothetical protein